MRLSRKILLTPTLLTVAALAIIDQQIALGQDWIGGDGFWSEPSNWHTNSVPGIADLAFIGRFESTVKDLSIQIDQPAFVEDLRIGNGNQVTNRLLPAGDAFPVSVQAALAIRGENALNPGPSQPAALFVYPSAAPVDLTASQVSLSADSELRLRLGAVANIGTSLLIGPDARLSGQGVVNFNGAFFTASNDGIIDAQGVMTINQLGDAQFDLDGTNESGKLFVGGNSFGDGEPQVNDHFTFNGTSLTDPFSGQLTLANDRRLTMNLAESWTLDAESIVQVGIDGATNQPAVIEGAPVTLEGELSMTPSLHFGEFAHLVITSEATINASANISLGSESRLEFIGATVNGGQFTLNPGTTELLFSSVTALRGGVFSTHSDAPIEGVVTFRGPTDWDGEVTINGVARQFDDATVSGPTVINAQRFDLDGSPGASFQADWQVNSALVVNAENIQSTNESNTFGSEMTIGGGATSQFTLNLADPEDFWTMEGTLNLNNALPLGTTRLAGSKIWLKGEVNVSGTDVRVNADTRFGAGTTTNFATSSSSLGMRKKSHIDSGAMFVGEGTLTNKTTGKMILADGATLDETGLVNQGLLMIGDSPGIASVDSFANASGSTWLVEVGGYLAGDEHDQLQVTGSFGTLLDGLLGVDLIDAGSGLFIPEVGDEFVILTSVGNVSGTFDAEPISIADGKEFQWELLYHPHDVTLRLVAIENIVPEPSTLLLAAGCLVTGFLPRRRRSCLPTRVGSQRAVSSNGLVITFCGALLTLIPSDRLQAAVTYRTLNLTGLPAAGTDPGINYDAFSARSLSDSGNAVFLAGLQGPGVIPLENDRGIYLTDSVNESLVARGDDIPTGFVGDVAYDNSTLGLFYVSGGGENAVFDTQLTGDGVNVGNNRGVFQGTTEGAELIALESGWAPGAGHGVVFSDINISATNNSGQSVASVQLDGVGVNAANDGAMYSFGLGSANLIAREGQQVPGAGPGTTFGFLSVGDPQISNTGQVTFIGPHSGGVGIFTHTETNGLQEVVLSGTAAPSAVVGTNFFDVDFFSVNDAGATLFRGFTDGPAGQSTGLYVEEDGLQLLVERGQTAPGTFLNPQFELFGNLAINGAGHVAFTASLMGPAVNETNQGVLYKIVDGSLEYVLRQNDLVPDATDAARFGEVNSFYFNDAGQIAFFSFLQGENVDDSNDRALFAEVDGQLRVIARKGDLFDVDADPLTEDLREVAFLTAAVTTTAGSQDGRTSLFNSAGQLLFSLSFTDGSQGLFVADTGTSGDFDTDGDVDGHDFLAWQRGGSPIPFSAADLAVWEASFGNTGPAALAASSIAVPEPVTTSLSLATLLLLAMASDPRRRAANDDLEVMSQIRTKS